MSLGEYFAKAVATPAPIPNVSERLKKSSVYHLCHLQRQQLGGMQASKLYYWLLLLQGKAYWQNARWKDKRTRSLAGHGGERTPQMMIASLVTLYF